MKTAIQRQQAEFRLRVANIARGIEGTPEFLKGTHKPTATITLPEKRVMTILHDVFHGRFLISGSWPKGFKGRTLVPTESKIFNLGHTLSDDKIVAELKEKFIPWLDVELELMAETLRRDEDQAMTTSIVQKSLAEAAGLKQWSSGAHALQLTTPDGGKALVAIEALSPDLELNDTSCRLNIEASLPLIREVLAFIQKGSKK